MDAVPIRQLILDFDQGMQISHRVLRYKTDFLAQKYTPLLFRQVQQILPQNPQMCHRGCQILRQ